MHSTLLAVHVTLALALTVLLGVQCAELGRLGSLPGGDPPVRQNLAALTGVGPVTVLVVITGGLLLRDDDDVQGGPWVGAGVVSAVVILASSLWVRSRAGRVERVETSVARALQIGAPAFVLAAAFLMAARPHQVALALAPVAVALAATAAAFVLARRSESTSRASRS